MLKSREPVYQALWVDNADFDEVIISPAMIQDHMPDTVLAALNKVSSPFLYTQFNIVALNIHLNHKSNFKFNNKRVFYTSLLLFLLFVLYCQFHTKNLIFYKHFRFGASILAQSRVKDIFYDLIKNFYFVNALHIETARRFFSFYTTCLCK